MFSDTYKMKLVDEVLYEVTGKVSSHLNFISVSELMWRGHIKKKCMSNNQDFYIIK